MLIAGRAWTRTLRLFVLVRRDLGQKRTAIFLQAGLDDPNQVDPTGESFLKAHEHFLDPPAGYAPLIFPNRDGCGFGGVSGFRGLRKITLFDQLHEAEHVATGLLKQFTKRDEGDNWHAGVLSESIGAACYDNWNNSARLGAGIENPLEMRSVILIQMIRHRSQLIAGISHRSFK